MRNPSVKAQEQTLFFIVKSQSVCSLRRRDKLKLYIEQKHKHMIGITGKKYALNAEQIGDVLCASFFFYFYIKHNTAVY